MSVREWLSAECVIAEKRLEWYLDNSLNGDFVCVQRDKFIQTLRRNLDEKRLLLAEFDSEEGRLP